MKSPLLHNSRDWSSVCIVCIHNMPLSLRRCGLGTLHLIYAAHDIRARLCQFPFSIVLMHSSDG